ncbi:hypothetical protein [Salinicoccus roseus]|uniref:hypothetical protein n=1 Tax=Salinicoccus roseus TaxID=45670 RepID=UPI001584A2CD|nr:hypothetical protein [Salinicoccus roseus]
MSISDVVLLIGVPFGTAFLTLLVNLYTSHKNFKAEVVSKSRIDWIQDVRNVFTDFTAAGQNLSMMHMALTHSQVRQKDYEQALSEFKGYYSKIYLYFSVEDPDNTEIHALSSKFYNEAVEYDREIVQLAEKTEKGMNKELKRYLERYRENEIELLKEVNFYLNNQWIRSKRLEIGNKTLRERTKKDGQQDNRNKYKIKDNIHRIDMNEYK